MVTAHWFELSRRLGRGHIATFSVSTGHAFEDQGIAACHSLKQFSGWPFFREGTSVCRNLVDTSDAFLLHTGKLPDFICSVNKAGVSCTGRHKKPGFVRMRLRYPLEAGSPFLAAA